MHPNSFLNTYWRLELKPQVFVAMSFSHVYHDRYERIIKPAIESITVNGTKLSSYRVDNSKTGESIHTDILEGIAHSQLVLADVSTLGHDSNSGEAYRNGNVLYEVGLALACRQPQEVLLIRGDKDRFLFDVSTIPHMHVDFANTQSAMEALHVELKDRLREVIHFRDARVQMAISKLSPEEVVYLKQTFEFSRQTIWGTELKGVATWRSIAHSRLLDKQVIQMANGEFDENKIAFSFTDLGWVVQQHLKKGLHKFVDRTNESMEQT